MVDNLENEILVISFSISILVNLLRNLLKDLSNNLFRKRVIVNFYEVYGRLF